MCFQLSRRSFVRSVVPSGAVLAMPAMAAIDTRSSGDFAKFRSAIEGELLIPADDGFEQARRVASFNPYTDKTPALIARCTLHFDHMQRCEWVIGRWFVPSRPKIGGCFICVTM